eukprot:GAHX01002141.1.p1 GENE.GAHX01002141.1~~GAHX01002141.1.p1  ORF type:complete len:360 (-),score=54.94 GAHX01002141.1:44-1123(-)
MLLYIIILFISHVSSEGNISICSTSLHFDNSSPRRYFQIISITNSNSSIEKDTLQLLGMANLINEIKLVIIEAEYQTELVQHDNTYLHEKDNNSFSKLEFLNKSLQLILENNKSINLAAFSYFANNTHEEMSRPYTNTISFYNKNSLNTKTLSSKGTFSNAFYSNLTLSNDNGSSVNFYSLFILKAIPGDSKLGVILVPHIFSNFSSSKAVYCSKVEKYDELLEYGFIDHVIEYYARTASGGKDMVFTDTLDKDLDVQEISLSKVEVETDLNIEQDNGSGRNNDNLIIGVCYFIVFCCLSFFGIVYFSKIKKTSKSFYRKVKRRLSNRYYPINMKKYEERKKDKKGKKDKEEDIEIDGW